MVKRLLVIFICVIMGLTMSGCWNYRGLDQMDIVVGIAVDFDKETNKYKVSYEIADLMGANKNETVKGTIVEAEGNTLFDAARNAKRQEADKMYFGSEYIVVISQEIAKEKGISHIIEWFLRDGECRETIFMVVSMQDTARSILEGEDAKGIVSVKIHDIVMEDNKVTSSTISKKLYEVFSTMESKRKSAMLSAFTKIEVGDKEVCQLQGTAVFKEDKLIGFLSPEESKYALFVENQLKGGILTLSLTGAETDDTSLEIFRNKTSRSFKYEDGKIKIHIKTETHVSVGENQSHMDVMEEDNIKRIEKAAEELIEKNIRDVIAVSQNELNVDIFGLGETVYKRDLKLWKQLEPSWEEIFPTIEIEVTSKVKVANTAFTR